jgi:hypothetical protein
LQKPGAQSAFLSVRLTSLLILQLDYYFQKDTIHFAIELAVYMIFSLCRTARGPRGNESSIWVRPKVHLFDPQMEIATAEIEQAISLL